MAQWIGALTRGDRKQMASWVRAWIERELSCRPADWEAFEESARCCYRYNESRWPGVFVRVPSPLVGTVAAPAVMAAINPRSLIDCAVDGYPSQALGWAAFGLAILAADGGPASRAAQRWFAHVRAEALPAAAHIALREAERMAHDGELRDSISIAVAQAVQRAFEQAVIGKAEIFGPAHIQTGIQFRLWDLDHAIRKVVDAAVLEEIREGVSRPIEEAVRIPLHDVVWDAVRWAAGAQNSIAWPDGGWGFGTLAANDFLREVCGLELPNDLWAHHLAYRQACRSAGWWWPAHLFLIASDRPSEIRLRRSGLFTIRRELPADGCAIVWRDGTALRARDKDNSGPRWQITPKWNAYPWYKNEHDPVTIHSDARKADART